MDRREGLLAGLVLVGLSVAGCSTAASPAPSESAPPAFLPVVYVVCVVADGLARRIGARGERRRQSYGRRQPHATPTP